MTTRLREAILRSSAIASVSETAGGSRSGVAVRIASGTAASSSSASEAYPTVRSMRSRSASSGPMCRVANGGAASSASGDRSVIETS